MPRTMPERMAIQETLMEAVREDVAVIKRDVKTLLVANERQGMLATIVKAIPFAALITAGAALLLR